MKCPNCGRENSQDARLCDQCGHLFSEGGDGDRLTSLQSDAPQELQRKLRDTHLENAGERKPVTILFADIVGSTTLAEKLDPEEWKEVVTGAHRRVGEAIYRYEGTIAQLLGDGVLAFFGAPITHEDDPIRAVHAALDIQESMAGYKQELAGVVDDFQMRIGINTGTVVIGDIGTDMHVEYLAIGDAVNIAARLQSAAEPGKVLLSEGSARMVRSDFELEDLGEIEVKGKTEPISVFEVVGAKTEPEGRGGVEGKRSPHIGRDRELVSLQEGLLSLCKGHGQVVAVLGEAGIGKSRLVEEIRALAADEFNMAKSELERVSLLAPPSSLHWFEGRALSYGSSLSFWTITQLLLADLGLSSGAPEVKIRVALRRRLKALFGEGDAEVLSPLSHLLGLSEQGAVEQGIRSLDGESLKGQTLASIKDYFAAVANEGPTVMVFEDMHWADPSSLEALENMLSLTDRAPLMILLLMRVDRDHGSWGVRTKAEADLSHRYSEIHLKRLSVKMSTQLVNHLLGIAELPEEIQDLILERSEGNPFYLEEVINHLTEQSLIVKDDLGWHATEEITAVGIPDTLQGVLLARIDRLEEEVRHTLQMASVIGKSFPFRLLEAISEAERELDEHLSQLQRVDLVREKALIPELEYMFKHSLTQETAYNSLLHERRREFHLKVGEALESLFADRREEFLGLLAHHFEAAQAHDKALDYLVRAGDQARLAFALQEAIDFYQRALVFLKEQEDYERSARTLMKLGLTYHNAFDFQQARHAIDESFAIRQQVRETRPADLPPAPHPFRIVQREPPTLDPTIANDMASNFYIWKMFSGLMLFGPGWEIIPEMARSWEVSEDGRHYVFNLRDDVYWSDGTQVTAEDFVYAMKRTLTPSTEAPQGGVRILYDIKGARSYHLGEVSDHDQVGVRAIDALTLEYELEKPASYFLFVLANLFPVPRHVVEAHGDAWTDVGNIVTNGPFQLESYQPSERITLVRNPSYHGHFSGNLQRVEVQLNVNRRSTEELEIYESNGVDFAQLGEETYHVRHRYADEYISEPSPSTSFVRFDTSRPPFDDLRVRRAFAMAVDRERLADEVVGGFHYPATGGFVPPGIPGHSPGIGLPYDPDQARQLLTQAGYPDGRDFPSLSLVWHVETRGTEYLGARWFESLNVEVTLEKVDMPNFLKIALGRNLSSMGWVLDYPDPDNFLRVCVQSRVPDWQNEIYNRMLGEAQRTSNLNDRIRLYKEADKILIEEAAIVPITYLRWHYLVKPWVKIPTDWLSSWTWKDVILEQH